MKRYMNKLMMIFAFIALFVYIAPVHADVITRLNENSDLKSYVIINTGATYNVTNVAVTTIIPGTHRIIGAVSTPYISGAGTNTFSLYDNITVTGATLPSTTATAASFNLFGEYIAANTAQNNVALAYPRKLANGLSVGIGPGTVCTIFYEEYHY